MSSLRHPLFWCALAVLALNDHVLKHADVLPGAVTGKLSDFAGLVVAPLVAAAILRARTRLSRGLAFALPTVPFVAINLSPAAADAAEAAMGAVGIPWTVWTDPTDLVALAILPVSWQLAAGGGPALRRPAIERAAVVAGALACMATSKPPPTMPAVPSYNASAWIANRTGAELDVRIRWVEAEISCVQISTDPARALAPELFGEGITFRLAADENVPLDRAGAAAATGAVAGAPATTTAPDGCDVALVQADALPSTIVYMSGLDVRQIPATGEAASVAGPVTIAPRDVGLGVEATGVTVAPALERVEPSGCFDERVQTFEYSVAGLPAFGSYRLEAKTTLADGCTMLSLADDLDGTPHSAFLCAPAWAFPFEAGDRLRIEAPSGPTVTPRLRITEEHEDGTFGAGIEVRSFQGTFGVGPVDGTLQSGSCGADRTSCGAYVARASLELDTPDGTLFVAPGEVVELGLVDGAPATLALGRADEVLVTRAGCEPRLGALGLYADVIIMFEEVVR